VTNPTGSCRTFKPELKYTFTHEETTNKKPCDYAPQSNPCSDKVTFSLPTLTGADNFIFDGMEYSLELTGFLVNGLEVKKFITQESQMNMAHLQAKVNAVGAVVPIPAAAW